MSMTFMVLRRTILMIVILAIFVCTMSLCGKGITVYASSTDYKSYSGYDYTNDLKNALNSGAINENEYNNRVAVLDKAQKMVSVIWTSPVSFHTWKSGEGTYNKNTNMLYSGSTSTYDQFVKGCRYVGVPYAANVSHNTYDDASWISYVSGNTSLTAYEGTVTYLSTTRYNCTNNGIDCSGFLYRAYSVVDGYKSKVGHKGTSELLNNASWKVINKANALPGDILLKSGHVMIYVGKTVSGKIAVMESTADGSNGYSGCRYYEHTSVSAYNYYRYTGFSMNSNPIVHTIDTNYPTNFTATAKWDIDVLNEDHSDAGNHWIDDGDVCTINEVYTDGCCKVTYPSSASGTATYFAHISDFYYIAQPSALPTNVSLTKNQNWYDLQDTIELTPHADNATSYWMSIVKNDQLVVSCAIDGTYGISAQELGGIGDYYVWITAYNSVGSTDSPGVHFSVVGTPGYSNVCSSKTNYDISENVVISVDTFCAKGQVIGINKDGYGRIITQDCNTSYTVPASQLGVGTFFAYFTVYNGSNTVDTDSILFTISDKAPQDVYISMNQYWYDLEDTVIITPHSDNHMNYFMSIKKNNDVIVSKEIDNSFSVTARELGGIGNYYVWITAYNSSGSTDSKGIFFDIVGKPENCMAHTAKDIYSTSDIVSLSASAVCAKGQFVGINRIGYGRVITQECNSTFNIAASELGEGEYEAYFSIYNGSGSVDTECVKFAIHDDWTVTYDANGGDNAPKTQYKSYGVDLTLSSAIPTRTGFTFKNWNTRRDGSGISYSAGGTYCVNADVALYAQWISNRIPGDVNNDGEVSTMDATLIKRYIVGGYDITTFIEANADVNGDGEITTMDATLIKRYIVGGYGVILY